MKETTVLVGLISKNQNEEQVSEYLDELAFLAETAGAETLKRFTQRLEHPDSKTFIGSGKLEQIRVFMVENNVKLAIFDDELSGSQIRNIEKILDCRVLDRNNLILDIFANRARTAQAKAQVELAQYQYILLVQALFYLFMNDNSYMLQPYAAMQALFKIFLEEFA